MQTQSTNEIAISISTLLAWLRDGVVFAAFATFMWKVRGTWDELRDFKKQIVSHMNTMESFAQTALTNHLYHMEQDLKAIASRNHSDSDKK